MRLQNIALEQFRSYDKLALSFQGDSSHMLSGENGSGKTNIMEAISLLSHGRSCLKADFEDMLRFGTDFFRIRADLLADAGEAKSVECVFQVSPRRATAYFVQDVRTPLLHFIGALPSIVFLPQDLDLFTGSPSGRRSFVDSLLSQLQPDYARLRMEYEKVLKQRNALLKQIVAGETKESDVDIWDEQLVAAALPVLTRRGELLSLINETIAPELSRLGEQWHDATMQIVSGVSSDTPDVALRDALKKYRSRDLILQSTTVGPHRDDWQLLAGNRNIALFASRGQQRTALLALLFVSAALFSTIRGERPVIILDDVLSELDENHQRALLLRLKSHQVFVTTTHPLEHPDIQLWSVNKGVVVPQRDMASVRSEYAP